MAVKVWVMCRLWHTFFMVLAVNRVPRSVIISQGYLTCTKKCISAWAIPGLFMLGRGMASGYLVE